MRQIQTTEKINQVLNFMMSLIVTQTELRSIDGETPTKVFILHSKRPFIPQKTNMSACQDDLNNLIIFNC